MNSTRNIPFLNVNITSKAMNFIRENSEKAEIILWKRSISGCFLAYDELVISIKRDMLNFNFDEFIHLTISGIKIFVQPEAMVFIEDMPEITIDFKDDEFFPSLYIHDVKPITYETTC